MNQTNTHVPVEDIRIFDNRTRDAPGNNRQDRDKTALLTHQKEKLGDNKRMSGVEIPLRHLHNDSLSPWEGGREMGSFVMMVLDPL